MKIAYILIPLAAALSLVSCDSAPAKKNTLSIAAASDLRFAMDSIISLFRLTHPSASVSVTYGSSGKFFEQIQRQAPFDVYFSADVDYAKKLDSLGLTAGRPTIYAIGRIVVWSNKINTRTGMTSLLDKQVNKVAIANPAHAPYGKRAVEALQYYGIYDQVEPKFVMGENVSQAAQYVSSGAAEIGIIALSLALSLPAENTGNYFLIPGSAHRPLEQAYVILKKTTKNSSAVLFTEFISTEETKDIFRKYGFTLPE